MITSDEFDRPHNYKPRKMNLHEADEDLGLDQFERPQKYVPRKFSPDLNDDFGKLVFLLGARILYKG